MQELNSHVDYKIKNTIANKGTRKVEYTFLSNYNNRKVISQRHPKVAP